MIQATLRDLVPCSNVDKRCPTLRITDGLLVRTIRLRGLVWIPSNDGGGSFTTTLGSPKETILISQQIAID